MEQMRDELHREKRADTRPVVETQTARESETRTVGESAA